MLSAAKDTITEKLSNIKAAYDSHGGGIKGAAFAAMEGVKGYYTAGYSFINNLTGGKLEEVKAKFTEKLSAVKTTVSEAFTNVKSTVGNLMSQATSNARSNLESMKAAYTSAGGGIKGVMAASMQGIKNTVSNVLSAINTITGGKLEAVRNIFQSKIEGAKQVVSNGLNAIRNFFSALSLKLPDIKLPHFSISGSFLLTPPSIPKIGVEWYKDGGILTGPTIFGANNGSLLGGGEAGREAVLPLSELWQNMRSVVAGVVGSAVPQTAADSGGAGMFDRIRQLVNGPTAGSEGGSVTKELYNTVNNNNTVNKTSEANSSDNSSKVVFSPQITIQGNAEAE